MKRRNFLATTLATPVTIFAARTEDAGLIEASHFVVRAGEARSGIHTPFKGINVNDVKISGRDTGGQRAVFSISTWCGTSKSLQE